MPSVEMSECALLVKDGQGCHSLRGGKVREVFSLSHGDHWTVSNGHWALTSNDSKLKQTLGVDKSAAIAELQVERNQLTVKLKDICSRQTQLERECKDYQK